MGPAILPQNVRAKDSYELNEKELAILMEFVGMEAEKSLKPTLNKGRK